MEWMQLSYGITIEQVDGQFVVTIPDFPEARATATRFSDAFDAATACLEAALAERIARAEPIPTSSRILGCKATPGTAIASKALLHKILLETGRTAGDLAEKLGTDEAAVRRLLDPDHQSDPAELSAAVAALGVRLALSACSIRGGG